MPVGRPASAVDELFGKPEIERNFQASLRNHGGKPLKTTRDHRDFPWKQAPTPQSPADWKCASKLYVNKSFASSLRGGADASASAPPSARSGSAPPRRASTPRQGSPKRSARHGAETARRGVDIDPEQAAADRHERVYQQASADTLDRRVQGSAADWRASSKPYVERKFASSLRSWEGLEDVGADQQAINNSRIFVTSDPDRWPNNYGPTSFGGWKRVTKTKADEIFSASLRSPSPQRA